MRLSRLQRPQTGQSAEPTSRQPSRRQFEPKAIVSANLAVAGIGFTHCKACATCRKGWFSLVLERLIAAQKSVATVARR